MTTRVFAIVSVILLLLTLQASAQPALDFGPLDKIAVEELAALKTPGAAIAIVQGDRVIFSKGYGLSSVETRSPVSPEMVFRLGSTTKMFTALALVSLAHQGKIDLHRPVSTYVTGLSPRLSQITGHQLLSHQSGILDEAPMFGSNDEDALAKGIRSWKDDRFFTEPGRIYSYSNPGYWFSGFLIETLSGRLYAEQLAETIFKPLGMSRTTFRPLIAMTFPMAQGHEVTNDEPTVIRPAANNTASWPAGSMFSNVFDLSRFAIAFMNGGRIDARDVLPAAVIERMQTPNVGVPGSDAKYAYGLRIETLRGVPLVHHGGSRAGYGSIVRMAPSRKFAVIILANRTGSSLEKTADKAMEIALGLPPVKESSRRTPMAMSDAEMERFAGVYSQGGTRRMEIVKKNGKLYVKQGSQENELNKVADNELAYAESRIVLVPGSDGSIAYLHAGGRSWASTKGRP